MSNRALSREQNDELVRAQELAQEEVEPKLKRFWSRFRPITVIGSMSCLPLLVVLTCHLTKNLFAQTAVGLATGVAAAEFVAYLRAKRRENALKLAEAMAELERMARTDYLTGIANRRTYDEAIQSFEAGDALVLIDIDKFKLVNDTVGHLGGDRVLKDFAKCMKEAVRYDDMVARLGGDELAMILRGSTAENAWSIVDRLRVYWEGYNPVVTFSAGIAIFDGEERYEDLERRADRALYRSKSLGRNCSMFARASEEFEMTEQAEAIANSLTREAILDRIDQTA